MISAAVRRRILETSYLHVAWCRGRGTRALQVRPLARVELHIAETRYVRRET